MADRKRRNGPMRELDLLLDELAEYVVDSSESLRAQVTTRSGRLYRTITTYWPRIAVGLLIVAAGADLLIDSQTADTRLEFYLLAWGTTTGALWFLFEKLDKVATLGARTEMSAWLLSLGRPSPMHTWSESFAALFDRVFGKKHLSWRCLLRSSFASVAFVSVVTLVYTGLFPEVASAEEYFWLIPLAVTVNLVADYLSLLETRWLLRWVGPGSAWYGVVMLLTFDVFATGAIWWASFNTIPEVISELISFARGDPWDLIGPAGESWGLREWSSWMWNRAQEALSVPPADGDAWLTQILFLSTFFTSVWLWLHTLTLSASAALLRMNSGLGFLLRVTDVERQPFRSMGFVSVLIVSGLFLVGLPFVLL